MNVCIFCDYVQAASLAVGQYESGWRKPSGKMIVGVSTLLFVVVLISNLSLSGGLVKALKNSLEYLSAGALEDFGMTCIFAGGMYALFLVAMALTE